MKTIKIGKHSVEVYSGIKDMLMDKYNQMQALLLQDIGIGSTMQDVEKRLKGLDLQLSVGNNEAAMLERQNLQLAIYSAIEQINYKSLAFACLIHAVDGVVITDQSDEGLQNIINQLDELKVGEMEALLDDLKKNCILN